MLQQGSIALGQGTPFRFLELVGSRREIVGADHLRQPTQGPKRTLQPLLQSFKGLSEGQVHESPPRVAEDELEEEVGKGQTGDVDSQFAGVGEIHLGFPARWMYLRKEHLLFRAMQGTPVPKAPL